MPDVDLYQVNNPMPRTGINYEILMILNGSMEISSFSQSFRLRASDIILLHPATVFQIQPRKQPLVLLSVKVEPQLVGAHLDRMTLLVCRSKGGTSASHAPMQAMLAEIAFLHYNGDSSASFQIGALVFRLLDYFVRLPIEETGKPAASVTPAAPISSAISTASAGSDDDNESETAEEGRYSQRLQILKTYVSRNYRQPVTLSEVAAHLDLTPQYLSRFVKKHLGQSFTDYLNDARLDAAVHSLCHSNETITKIAFNSGFPNLSAFSMLFRDKYKASPLQYRQAYKSQTGRHGQRTTGPGQTSFSPVLPDLTAVQFSQVSSHLDALRAKGVESDRPGSTGSESGSSESGRLASLVMAQMEQLALESHESNESGDGCLVVKRSDRSYAVLVSRTFKIQLPPIAAGKWRIRQYRLNADLDEQLDKRLNKQLNEQLDTWSGQPDGTGPADGIIAWLEQNLEPELSFSGIAGDGSLTLSGRPNRQEMSLFLVE